MALDGKSSRWEIARRILSDHHGVWCAWCLDYIRSPEELELHHVLGKRRRIVKVFGMESWVVPVHAPMPEDICHRRGLQQYADEGARELLRRNSLTGEKFEAVCKSTFDHGYLPACLLLRRNAWLKAANVGDANSARQNLLFALNAAAGTGLGRGFLKQLRRQPYFDQFEDDIDNQLYVSTIYANSGDFASTRETCNRLNTEVPRVRPASSPTYAKLVRVKATVMPTLQHANEALEIARDSWDPIYHRRTSELALASAFEVRRNYGEAHDLASKLWFDFDAKEPSWWHHLAELFLWGRTCTVGQLSGQLNSGVSPSFIALIRAQYGCALLNFAGIPTPDFRETSQEPQLAQLTPTEVIDWAGKRYGISRDKMKELRCEALWGRSGDAPFEILPLGFQANVLKTLTFRGASN